MRKFRNPPYVHNACIYVFFSLRNTLPHPIVCRESTTWSEANVRRWPRGRAATFDRANRRRPSPPRAKRRCRATAAWPKLRPVRPALAVRSAASAAAVAASPSVVASDREALGAAEADVSRFCRWPGRTWTPAWSVSCGAKSIRCRAWCFPPCFSCSSSCTGPFCWWNHRRCRRSGFSLAITITRFSHSSYNTTIFYMVYICLLAYIVNFLSNVGDISGESDALIRRRHRAQNVQIARDKWIYIPTTPTPPHTHTHTI